MLKSYNVSIFYIFTIVDT